MTYQGTVALDDPRRHIRLELRTRQLLAHMLRCDRIGWNDTWADAFLEFGQGFYLDAIGAVPTLLRQHLDDDTADELAGCVAQGIPYLMACLEDFRP